MFTGLLQSAALAGLLVSLAACSPHRDSRSSIEFPAPTQAGFPTPIPAVMLSEGRWLEPKAFYSVDAYVLASTRYSRDLLSEVSAADLVLAWGPSAKPQSVHGLKVSQRDRTFDWEAVDEPLLRNIGPKALKLSMANTTVIGANADLHALLKSVKPGEALRAQGYLVDVKTRESTVFAKTSIKRDDEGPGSTEIFYVTQAEVLDPGF